MSRYELIEGTSRKFWDVSRRGTLLLVRWGRNGATGRSKLLKFPTAAAAREQQTKLIREKSSKGYRLVKSARAANEVGGARPTRRVAKAAAGASAERPRARLRAAFAALNTREIVAIENAGYTQSDGWDDVNEVATKLASAGKHPRAGVFYHGQDAARGKRGQGLFLTFGSYAKRNAAADSVAVGQIIVEVLEAHGFRPKWDGSLSTRIHTGRFEWR